MRILLFSDISIPDSCALATRVMVFAKLLRQLGHETELLGVSYRKEEALEGSFDGIPYRMLRASSDTGLRAGRRVARLNKDIKTYLAQMPKFDTILLSNVYYDYAAAFLAYAKTHGAKLLVNQVEWYDRKDIRFGGITGKINLLKNRIALRHLHVKMGNILAISSLLDDYYKNRGCNTVTIPTIIDPAEYAAVASQPKAMDPVLKIAYAGSPARKDYIANAIRALPLLSKEERKRIQFHFYGPQKEQLAVLGVGADFLETYKEQLVCHGRIPHCEVKEKIAQADFTVLLRPDKRYANAGFPTKVGESMACGTPVIANLTSDLGKYIIDGQTGILCADETPESCAEAFRKALALTDAQRAAMHENCLEMTQKAFSYSAYQEAIEAFLHR